MKYLELLRAQLVELYAKRDAHLSVSEALAETLTAESRAATDEENALARSAVDDAIALDEPIAEVERQIAKLSALAERKAPALPASPAFVGRAGGGDSPYDIDLRSAPRTAEVRRDVEARALRAVEQSDMSDTNKTHVDAMLRNKRINRGGALARHLLVTGSDAYREAFNEVAFRANPILNAEQANALQIARGLQITADASGGFLMPFTLDPTIILTNAGVINPIREIATVITVATDNWQGVASAGVTASYDAEESEVSDDTPALSQPSIAVHQGQAFVPFSVQAEDDLDALAADVSEMFADAKDRLELNAFTLGTGTGQPFGFVTEAATVASTTADTYAVADIYKLQNGVSPRYRRSAQWMANLSVINLTRQFGTANNYHGFLTDLGGGKPSVLLGQNLYENSEMDGTVDAAATNKILAYGDFSKYRIHDRIGMTIELVPFLFGATRRPTGQRGWYCRFRHGARLVDTNAVKLLDA